MNLDDSIEDELDPEVGDPSVPTELLDLYVELEEAGVAPEEFKEAFGDQPSDET